VITPQRTPDLLDVPVVPGSLVRSAGDRNRAPKNPDPAWAAPESELARWSKLYPYQLLVLEAVPAQDKSVTYRIHPDWEFTLPLPPEAYKKGMPFAITTSASQRGVVTEHGGAPFRIISIRGTLGGLPARGTGNQRSVGARILDGVAPATLDRLRGIKNDAESVLASAAGTVVTNPNVHEAKEFEGSVKSAPPVAKTSGFYQARLLQNFLEAYVGIKMTSAGKNLQMAVATWKDQEVLLCDPVDLNIDRVAQRPLEYLVDITLKAFRRVKIDGSAANFQLESPIRLDPNALARAMNSLEAARRVLQGVDQLAAAVVGDVTRLLFEPLRELLLVVKDAVGAAVSVADLPRALRDELRERWITTEAERSILGDPAGAFQDGLADRRREAGTAGGEIRPLTTTRQAEDRRRLLATSPAVKSYDAGDVELLRTIDVAQLRPPPALQRKINGEKDRVRQMRRADYEERRDKLVVLANRLAAAVGASTPEIAATYGISVAVVKPAPSHSDHETLRAIDAVVGVFDQFAATANGEPTRGPTSVEVMAGLARRSGIAFTTPTSKFAVPMPSGYTLPQLAQLYLGNADRYHEIVALNGLAEPFIDEVGFELPLLTNAGPDRVLLAGVEHQLYLGQPVTLGSTAVRRTSRRILQLVETGGNTVIILDGDPDLAQYQVVDGAVLHAFLPDTVNSRQLIWIPSQDEPDEDSWITKAIPGVDIWDPMVAVGGADLLLDSTNDVVITPDGDAPLATGLVNILQELRILLEVELGKLALHPGFGLGVKVGGSTADLDPKTVVATVKRTLADHPAVLRVETANVSKRGPLVTINATVILTGTTTPVPVQFEVRPQS
jgi:hypothetical protein